MDRLSFSAVTNCLVVYIRSHSICLRRRGMRILCEAWMLDTTHACAIVKPSNTNGCEQCRQSKLSARTFGSQTLGAYSTFQRVKYRNEPCIHVGKLWWARKRFCRQDVMLPMYVLKKWMILTPSIINTSVTQDGIDGWIMYSVCSVNAGCPSRATGPSEWSIFR